MKLIVTLSFIIASYAIFAQNEASIVKDFNEDGYIDSFEYHYDGGSGFGGRYCSLKNGKTGDVYEIDGWGCFCSIRKFTLIPPELSKPENAAFLEEFKKALLPPKRDTPDASLQWILNARKCKVRTDSSNNRYFSTFYPVRLNWQEGDEIPENYYLEMEGLELHEQYVAVGSDPDWYDKDKNKAWMTFYANNHARKYFGQESIPTIKSEDGKYTIESTGVGISIQRNGRYAWVFVSDYEVTGGPEKLRWPSIEKVELVNDHLIVLHGQSPTPMNGLLIINLRSGAVGKLNHLTDDFEVKNGKLIISDYDEVFEYNLYGVFTELSLQTR